MSPASNVRRERIVFGEFVRDGHALSGSVAAALRETHSGVVILIGDRAYKVKKPVDLGFLDFTTVRARADACDRELRLNRRLAPDVYLDVDRVVASSGEVTDHVVVMRRMPDERRLAMLVRLGTPIDDELRSLARLIAAFHARAERSETIAQYGTGEALRRRWHNNLDEARQFCGTLIEPNDHAEIERLALDYVDGRAPLFARRAETGQVVDGHGDLLAEDIFCLADGPRVLDCLDFDDALRYLDVLDDVAFLVMDLERLGRAELGERFLSWYREFSGSPVARSLEDHYIAYRAFVRAKVACIRNRQGDPTAAAESRRCVAITLRHLRAAEVRLILIGGAPATGKSTVATGLAEALGATLLSTDAVRTEEPPPAEVRYTDRATAAVYTRVLARARAALRAGESVVLDATWPTERLRHEAETVARDTRSRLVPFECVAPVEVCAARAQRRFEEGRTASEADARVARALAAARDPWPDAIALNGTDNPQILLDRARVACSAGLS